MATRTFPLEIVLPDLPGAEDACVERLTALTTGLDGVSLAHATEGSTFCVHFDPSRMPLAEVQRLVMAAGATLSAKYGHVSIEFRGVVSEDAGRRLEGVLRKEEGVIDVSASVAAQRVRVEFERARTDADRIRRVVEDAQFGVVYPSSAEGPRGAAVAAPMGVLRANRELAWSLCAAACLATAWVGERWWTWPPAASVPV